MSLVGRAAQVDDSGMLVVRALLLVVVALLFVMTVSLVFIRDTGLLEKLLLVAAAVLLALLVPRIQRLRRAAPPACAVTRGAAGRRLRVPHGSPGRGVGQPEP